MTEKKSHGEHFYIVATLIVALAVFACALMGCGENGTMNNPDGGGAEVTDNMVGGRGTYLIFTKAEVLEVVSDYSLIVEIQDDTIFSDDEDAEYNLYAGETVKVLFDDVDFRGDKLSELIVPGSVIRLDRFDADERGKVDRSVEPSVVKVTGVAEYAGDGKTLIFQYAN